MKATVSEKGQVTIPKALRDRLGIMPGQVLEFQTDRQGRLIATKTSTPDALEELYGILDLRRGTDDLVDEMRGPVDTVDST